MSYLPPLPSLNPDHERDSNSWESLLVNLEKGLRSHSVTLSPALLSRSAPESDSLTLRYASLDVRPCARK
jgi:hypothetical protein